LGGAAALAAVIALRAQPGSFLPQGAQYQQFRQYGQRVSPHETTSAVVDGARLTIVYGRPSMRGRVIFGALVPYGRVWCPGADEATTLESSRAIEIGAARIPTGPHTIWILPSETRWTLVISRESSGFHTRYNSRADLARVDWTRRGLAAPVEQLTFTIAPRPDGGGQIAMSWERTQVSVPFTVVQ
jgi:hypothetical protein